MEKMTIYEQGKTQIDIQCAKEKLDNIKDYVREVRQMAETSKTMSREAKMMVMMVCHQLEHLMEEDEE